MVTEFKWKPLWWARNRNHSVLYEYSHLWVTGWFFVIDCCKSSMYGSFLHKFFQTGPIYTHKFSASWSSILQLMRVCGVGWKRNKTNKSKVSTWLQNASSSNCKSYSMTSQIGWQLCSVMKQRSERIPSWDANKQKTTGAQIMPNLAIMFYQSHFSSYWNSSGTKGELNFFKSFTTHLYLNMSVPL